MQKALCASFLLLLTAAPLDAQQRYDASESDLAMLSVNALVGGASAGLVALARGEDFTEAFAAGTLGGGLSFAGKRLATANFAGAGFAGRQVAAIGHSIVVNAGRADPLLSEIWLPVGPLQVRVPSGRVRGTGGWDARVDVTSAVTTLYAASIPELELDWGATLEQGTFVFFAPGRRITYDGVGYGGLAPPGTILLSGDADREPRGILGHETVHVIQQDFIAMAWSYPVEEWVRHRLLPEHAWLEHFPIGGAAPALGHLLSEAVDDDVFVFDWMEHEAWSLTRRSTRHDR